MSFSLNVSIFGGIISRDQEKQPASPPRRLWLNIMWGRHFVFVYILSVFFGKGTRRFREKTERKKFLQRLLLAFDDLLGVGAVEIVDLHVHGDGQVLPHVVGVGARSDLHLLQAYLNGSGFVFCYNLDVNILLTNCLQPGKYGVFTWTLCLWFMIRCQPAFLVYS